MIKFNFLSIVLTVALIGCGQGKEPNSRTPKPQGIPKNGTQNSDSTNTEGPQSSSNNSATPSGTDSKKRFSQLDIEFSNSVGGYLTVTEGNTIHASPVDIAYDIASKKVSVVPHSNFSEASVTLKAPVCVTRKVPATSINIYEKQGEDASVVGISPDYWSLKNENQQCANVEIIMHFSSPGHKRLQMAFFDVSGGMSVPVQPEDVAKFDSRQMIDFDVELKTPVVNQ